ncbi:MAG: SRPBCC family protein [Pseudomonadota bacterium]
MRMMQRARWWLAGVLLAAVLIALLLRDTSAPVAATAEGDIAAPVARVWALQTDMAHWQAWNPDIVSMQMSGPLQPGTTFVWEAGGMTIRSTLTEVVPRQRIAWRGETFGIEAIHVWTFSERDGVTHVSTSETFTGPLAWLFPGTLRGVLADALTHGVKVLQQAAEGTRPPVPHG